ncbi:ATP cone domain-containing protein [Christiangramia echinicola]|uniref:Restriction endonuclease n=1 Tax=Christiangramia echinicola TaxID=279359 RepID=A0A1H1KX98_9FLAO|nr:ATP cone domain-containing protein [Christiangramia echinicola]SDR66405.1 Restriction endonuclease [Christiangramia echinicola]
MRDLEPDIIKSSGEKVKFSFSKLRRSLLKSGANESIVSSIIDEIRDELYQGISTKELYNRAFALLKDHKGAYASRYRLKKAIYELGPSGFPFEKFVAEILNFAGYEVELNKVLQGECVTHEVDIIAKKGGTGHLIECKFHSEEGRNCDVKIPLYINSRFNDIHSFEKKENQGWLVTNTRFTLDALTYGECVGLKLLSWDYPEEESLKLLIDNSGAYPITTSTLLSDSEKQFLLEKGIILGRNLLERSYLLDHQGVSENRKKRILSELSILCDISVNDGE